MAHISYQERLTQLVEPGERVLAVAKTDIAHGVRPPDPPAAKQSESSGAGVDVGAVLLNLISPLLSFPAGDRIVDRITHGVAGRAPPARSPRRCNTPGGRCLRRSRSTTRSSPSPTGGCWCARPGR